MDMNRIVVRGWGAISPAGWGAVALREALEKNSPLPVETLPRPGRPEPLRVRQVPSPQPPPGVLGNARLRRSTRIARHTVAAAWEALGGDAPSVAKGTLRLGIVVCVMTGGVSYSRRFYEEVLNDPAVASPLLFPETVFNAPASHLAACVGTNTETWTLVGDEGTFLQGVALAAHWLLNGTVERCLVVGSEESDWITADAMRLFEPRVVHSEGAGALYLGCATEAGREVELSLVTDAFLHARCGGRAVSAQQMRAALPAGDRDELLCLGTQDVPRLDAAERSAWRDWQGARSSPKTILGEAFTAAAAWQCVAACDALARSRHRAAMISVVGANQQAIGARFTAPESPGATIL
jgi:hypothetical protein